MLESDQLIWKSNPASESDRQGTRTGPTAYNQVFISKQDPPYTSLTAKWACPTESLCICCIRPTRPVFPPAVRRCDDEDQTATDEDGTAAFEDDTATDEDGIVAFEDDTATFDMHLGHTGKSSFSTIRSGRRARTGRSARAGRPGCPIRTGRTARTARSARTARTGHTIRTARPGSCARLVHGGYLTVRVVAPLDSRSSNRPGARLSLRGRRGPCRGADELRIHALLRFRRDPERS